MSTITHSPTPEFSTGSLFQLTRGQFKPNKLWECRRFRTKFLLRSLAFPVTTFSYMEQMSRLPAMRQALTIQGLLPAKIHRPYLCAHFSVKQRAVRCSITTAPFSSCRARFTSCSYRRSIRRWRVCTAKMMNGLTWFAAPAVSIAKAKLRWCCSITALPSHRSRSRFTAGGQAGTADRRVAGAA